MSLILATTRACIYRGSSTDAFGDDVDANSTPVPELASFPLSLIEKSRSVQDPSSGTWRTVRVSIGRPTNPSLDIRDGDRLRDLSTGILYAIDEITASRTIAGGRALVLDLTNLNG